MDVGYRSSASLVIVDRVTRSIAAEAPRRCVGRPDLGESNERISICRRR